MRRGFSLVEVVIAVGIVAGSVIAVLSLLPSLMRHSAETADLYAAQRLVSPIHVALMERAHAAGFVSFASSVPEMSSPLTAGWTLVGARDGLQVATPASGAIATSEQHFHIELWRFSEGPLRFDSSSSNVALHVRISWPYHVFGVDDPLPLSSREQFTFSLSLDR